MAGCTGGAPAADWRRIRPARRHSRLAARHAVVAPGAVPDDGFRAGVGIRTRGALPARASRLRRGALLQPNPRDAATPSTRSEASGRARTLGAAGTDR